MDTGTILAYVAGYISTMGVAFLLYLPVIILIVALLVAGGILHLLLLPFIALVRRIRQKPPPDQDPSWFLDRGRQV